MYIKQIFSGCLEQAAYYIESRGTAAIIDPWMDANACQQQAKANNATLKYVFGTGSATDYLKTYSELAETENIDIILGPGNSAPFRSLIAEDGQEFPVGDLTIRVLHTPGLTPGATCYLLKEEKGKDYGVFTGFNISYFPGTFNKTDQSQEVFSRQELAGKWFDSIHAKLVQLPDEVKVFHAPGPGFLGEFLAGPDPDSCIGLEKQFNYLLKAQSRSEFIRLVTTATALPSLYFPGKTGRSEGQGMNLDRILKNSMAPLSLSTFREYMQDDVLVVDTRDSNQFTGGFVPGSVSIGLNGRFADWAGTVLPPGVPLLLVCEEGRQMESIIRLARVGFDTVLGYLDGGYPAWKKSGEEIDMIIEVEPDELMMDIPFDRNLVLLDVRKPGKFAEGHLGNAINLPLSELSDPGSMANIEDNFNLYIHSHSGYSSVIAASLFKRQGIHNLRNITGGWKRIREEESVQIVKDASLLN